MIINIIIVQTSVLNLYNWHAFFFKKKEIKRFFSSFILLRNTSIKGSPCYVAGRSCNNINNIITIDDDDNEIFYSVEKLTCNNDDIILSDTENDFFEGRNITKHSGKVTLCTVLFNSVFDDKLIRQRSGHRSYAINVYKRPNCTSMQQSVSNTLQPPKPTNSTSSCTNTKKM